MRMVLLLGAVVLAGCGREVHTYRIAPYLEPGSTCIECVVSMTMRATQEHDGDELYIENFDPQQFKAVGFSFQWGVEQRVEIETERYPTFMQDDRGVNFIFRRVLETRPVESGTRFTMRFDEWPPGTYSEDLLVRDGDGFLLQGAKRVECATVELCEQLAARRPGEEAFALELEFPQTEGAPLRLQAVRDLP
ncbi:hypothetical protein ATI61_102465 [Archangium gephyra]|nr:hypothetical protein [Archangium gephyra]REG36091.1 hypothetical protein ATI61_102465 [Archangium gephyra]